MGAMNMKNLWYVVGDSTDIVLAVVGLVGFDEQEAKVEETNLGGAHEENRHGDGDGHDLHEVAGRANNPALSSKRRKVKSSRYAVSTALDLLWFFPPPHDMQCRIFGVR